MKRHDPEAYNPDLDGCSYDKRCETCRDARRARAEGKWVWIVCQAGSTVLSPAPKRERELLADRAVRTAE